MPIGFPFSLDVGNIRKVSLVFVYHHLILHFQNVAFQSGCRHDERK